MPITVRLNKKQRKRKSKLSKTTKAEETTAMGKVLRGLGSLGGGALGGYLGAPTLGGAAGNQLGGLLSKWLGFGDYSVSQNSIVSKAASGIPMMHAQGQSVVVRHREYIGPVLGSQAFKVQYSLPLNPGMPTFPWLSKISRCYQEYQMKGCVYHYIPTSGNAISGTNSALGQVMMQTTYRASDSAPGSKVEMLNEFCANESVPSESFIHPIECDPKENPFAVHYIRSTAPPTGEPLMSYDLGKTFVATNGQLADNTTLGDIWVTYEVELKKPLLNSDVITPVLFSSAKFGGGGTVDTYFSNPGAGGGTLPCTATASTLTIPGGYGTSFFIVFDFSAAAFSAFDGGSPAVTNGFIRALNVDGDGMAVSKVTSGNAQAIAYVNVVKVDPSLATTVNFGSTAFAWTGAYTAVELLVFSLG